MWTTNICAVGLRQITEKFENVIPASPFLGWGDHLTNGSSQPTFGRFRLAIGLIQNRAAISLRTNDADPGRTRRGKGEYDL